jgi:deazaflavin-dependent oxidoreductase (nitroreductase family)
MPLPRGLGRFNRRVTNRILWPVLGRLPGFGLLVHVGRRSGRAYRTPLLGFRGGDGLTFALTYGPGADWVLNVVAAGACRFETRGGSLSLASPRVYRDPARQAVPPLVRLALALLRTDRFLELRVTGPEGDRISP